MISPEYIQILPISENKLKISWKFSQTTENFQDYSFLLQRSESPDDGFQTIYSFNHAVEFIDDIIYKKLWRSLYYRIVSIENKSGETTPSPAFQMTTCPDLEALEIVRRNDILLKNRRHGTGSPIAVFKLKTIGPKCPVCWDYNKQKVRSSNCDECYKTGIEGGYYDPIIAWANLTPPQKMVQLAQWGEMEPNEARFFMNNEPAVNPKDLIFVPSTMLFYQIERVETTTRREYILHQMISASGIDRSSITYKLLSKYPQLVSQLRDERTKIKVK